MISQTIIAEPASLHIATPRDYIALLKPRVMTLVVFTGIAGMMIAPASSSMHPFLWFIAILMLTIGAGSAGAINMWYDRDIDSVMSRTRFRPIPAGKISPENALAFALTLNIFATVFMGLALNWTAAGLLAFASFFYSVIYTMGLKRRTPQNIVIGGAAGAFPPVIGWVAMGGSVLHPLPWILFAIIFLWTPPHFWALALYKNDDFKRAKLPMLPLTHGRNSALWHIVFYAVMLGAVTVLPWIKGYFTWHYGVSAMILSGLFILSTIKLRLLNTDKAAKLTFGYSILYLFALFTAVLYQGSLL